ncbi:MAG: redox-regulated ATPase YchF [Bacillota bacterium]|nr:redox-regulated ATPase YchF [Bacillota bacterium]
MALTAGIVGLPNVGKSTLFNAITRAQVEAANYPFATIKPNVGVVEVPDDRIEKIVEFVHPKRTIYTTFEFTDIAGLVKGASKGEGLGNQFLSNIRETDAIVHVVRCFDDEDISHVEGDVDPIRDIEIINLELSIADLQSLENRIIKIERKALAKEKDAIVEYNVLKKIVDVLKTGKPARSVKLNKDEELIARHFNLLTKKPVIYVANVSEDDIKDPMQNKHYAKVNEFALNEGNGLIAISARIEEELSALDKDEKQMFLDDLGISESGLDRVIKAAYSLLDLQTFFTVGENEVRAWTFKKGMTAPECAGIIHSDFQRGFIKAETYSYDDLMKYKSEAAIKEHGRLRQEGKDYIVKDGDIILFKFNV